LKCGENALAHNGKGEQSYRRIRWYSLAEFLSGEVLSKLVKPVNQDASSQNSLRRSALIHFNAAASLGSKTPLKSLVLEPAKACFNTILNMPAAEFVDLAITMADQFIAIHDKTDPDFNVMFVRALLEGITEMEYWMEGERIIEAAFSIVPAAHQRILWETKMFYLIKQEKDVMMLIQRTKESSASLQSKVWLKYARSSSSTEEKHRAYSTAVDILRKAKSIESVDIMIEWASFKQSLGEDSTEILQSAADTLLEIEPEGDAAVEEESGEGEGSQISRVSRNSKSIISRMSRKTGKSSRSKMTVTSRFSKHSRTTRRSKKTTVSRLTSQDQEE
jgi:hypothetical protein